MPNDNLHQQLADGITALHLTLAPDQQQRLLDLLQLLSKWNRHFNLTGIFDLKKMISYHLLDSLAIAPHIVGTNVLDVGSGAGFPGIPLACYYPDKQFVLVESIGKKTHFLVYATTQLQLKNVVVAQERAEHLPAQHQFDCIVSRAVCSLQQLVDFTYHLSHPQTCWVAMKATLTETELQELKLPYRIIALQIRGIDAPRHAVIIQRAQ